ncbi:Ig heavy chain Mem5-like [Phyllobates terribilis]|uniref:Ig heavy chain Mem5-like n=1 Tax=Phyllobates terribilis TaxID=111132 RepID=UPI003CCB286A
MDSLVLLVIFHILVTGLSADQPEDVVFADPGNSVDLTCFSNTTQGTRLTTWYRRRERDLWTVINNNSQNVPSRSEENISHLVIDNVTSQDSGRYYCAGFNGKTQVFNKAMTLITAGISTSSSSIHLLKPHNATTHPFLIPLTCVVHAASPQVYVIWNISGTHIRGRMIFWEKPNGTWTILNSISLTGDTLKNDKKVTCEVWFTSTPISVHWEISQRGNTNLTTSVANETNKTWFTCWIPVIMTLVCVVVLMSAIFIYQKHKIHLKTRRKQKRNHTSRASSEHESDDIVYTELKINSQIRR